LFDAPFFFAVFCFVKIFMGNTSLADKYGKKWQFALKVKMAIFISAGI